MSSPRQTILVVEDETAIAETIVYALRTEGFEPLWKITGREALTALKQQAVALVVLDVGLPDMSGFDVCRELRKQHAVPVIFLTARSGEVDKIVGLELGADDYLAKPFSPRDPRRAPPQPPHGRRGDRPPSAARRSLMAQDLTGQPVSALTGKSH